MTVLLDVLTDKRFLNCIFVNLCSNQFFILKGFIAIFFCGCVDGELDSIFFIHV